MAMENFYSWNSYISYPFLETPSISSGDLDSNIFVDFTASINLGIFDDLDLPQNLRLSTIQGSAIQVTFTFTCGGGSSFVFSVPRTATYGETFSTSSVDGSHIIVVAVGSVSGVPNGAHNVVNGTILPSLVEYDTGVFQITTVNRERPKYEEPPGPRPYWIVKYDVDSNYYWGYNNYPTPDFGPTDVVVPTIPEIDLPEIDIPTIEFTVIPGGGLGPYPDWIPAFDFETWVNNPYDSPEFDNIIYSFNGYFTPFGDFTFSGGPGIGFNLTPGVTDPTDVDFDFEFDISQIVPIDPDWDPTGPPTGLEIKFVWHPGLPFPTPGGIFDSYLIPIPYPITNPPDEFEFDLIQLDNMIPEMAAYPYYETGELWRVESQGGACGAGYSAVLLDFDGNVATPTRRRCVYPLPSESSLTIGDEGICLIRSPNFDDAELGTWFFFRGGGGEGTSPQARCCQFTDYGLFFDLVP